MNWFEIAAITAVLVGVGAAGFLVAQRPSFWVNMGVHVAKEVGPLLLKYLSRRNSPEIERKMQDCIRRGGKWDNFQKRCRD